jgi:hypothetical protein
MVTKQKKLDEQKVTGKETPLGNSDPCCLPGCCDNSGSK